VLPLLLAEEFFLLAHDERGRPPTVAYEYGYSGALLMDLADAGLVVAVGKDLVPVPGAPTHPLLAAAHAALLASARPRTADFWVDRLRIELKPLESRVGSSLVERGVLESRPHRALGFYPTVLWPRVSPAPACDVRERVTRILVDGAAPDVRAAWLRSLLSASRLDRGLVDEPSRGRAEHRARSTAPASDVPASISGAVERLIRGQRIILFVVAGSLSLSIVMMAAMWLLYL